MNRPTFNAVTVTLNPAIDRTLTVRDFCKGSVNRVESETEAPGGKGVNVAIALADYGLKVAATGFLGRQNSSLFDDLFARKAIVDGFVRLDGRTRTGIKVFDPVDAQTTEINFPGLTPSAADLALLHDRLMGFHSGWMILAGSLPPGVRFNFYAELISALRKKGVHVALDTSGDALMAAAAVGPTLIKPNLDELCESVGSTLRGESEIVSAARDLVGRGVELVAVSLGEAGAIFVTATDALLARAPAVRAASTVGAGDAMVAGIVAGRLRNRSLSECARLATAFSVHALTRPAPSQSAAAAIEATASAVTVLAL